MDQIHENIEETILKTMAKKENRIFASMKAAASALDLQYSRLQSAKRAGCDAFKANGSVNEEKILAWFKERPVKKKVTGKKKVEKAPGKAGAGEALKRLELAEVEAHREYVETLAEDAADDTEKNGKLKAWQTIVSSLLSYETKVESSKRDAGQLIPQSEVIEMAKSLMMWTNSAISDVLHNCTPRLAGCATPREYAAVIDPAMREALPIALNYAQRANKMPSWLAEAALRSAPSDRSFDTIILKSIIKAIKITKAEQVAITKITKKLNERPT